MRRLAVYAGLFAVAAAKSATEKSANAYSTANETVSGTPWRRKGGVAHRRGITRERAAVPRRVVVNSRRANLRPERTFDRVSGQDIAATPRTGGARSAA